MENKPEATPLPCGTLCWYGPQIVAIGRWTNQCMGGGYHTELGPLHHSVLRPLTSCELLAYNIGKSAALAEIENI